MIERYLTGLGLDTRTLSIDNGAGLSREARASAKLLADVLEHAWTIPYRPEFISSLAITGVDGTAKYRLKHKAASGYAHVKTGTIDEVSAVAGYVHARSGREYIVVGVMNRKLAHKGPRQGTYERPGKLGIWPLIIGAVFPFYGPHSLIWLKFTTFQLSLSTTIPWHPNSQSKPEGVVT